MYLRAASDTTSTMYLRAASDTTSTMYLHVLGGYNGKGDEQFSVLHYNIKDDTWKRCSDMPVACSGDVAGVVVHEGRIKVFTGDECLIYTDDADTWTVKQYNRLGNAVNAFVGKEQICAVEWNGDMYSMMSYDDVDNVWKTERDEIDNAWSTDLFC